MKNHLRLIRLSVGVLAAFAVLVGAAVSDYFDYYMIGLACMLVFAYASAGNVLNDYFDYEIDKVNRPHRPIPSGKVSRRNALVLSAVLFAAGSCLFYFINSSMIILAILNMLIVVAYNYKIKRTIAGHFVDAWLGSSPFIFGALLTSHMSFTVMILFIMAYFANLSRQTVKGIEDIAGDKKMHARTFAIALEDKAKPLAAFFAFISIAISPMPIIYGLLNTYYIPAIILCDIVWVYSIIRLKTPATSQKMMKIAMFLGIFAFLAGLI